MTSDLTRFSAALVVAVLAAAVLAIAQGELALRQPLQALSAELQTSTQAAAADQIALFDRVATFNEEARASFLDRVAEADPSVVNPDFDAYFPAFGDGTRRSIPSLYDGIWGEEGRHVYGIGAFLGDVDAMTREQQVWFWAGFQTVAEIGPQIEGMTPSLYYFTPDRRAVLFGPERSDRLEFYRFEAPANFNMRGDEDPHLFGAQTNPDRVLQCTRISRYIAADSGDRTAIACRIPLWSGDQLMGAIGSSIEITSYLQSAVETPPENGTIWLVDGDGQVIARHSDARDESHNHEIADILGALDPTAEAGWQRHDTSLVSFVRIPHADWVLITCIRIDELVSAARSRSIQLFLSLLAIFSILAAFWSGLLPLHELRRPALDEDPAQRPAE